VAIKFATEVLKHRTEKTNCTTTQSIPRKVSAGNNLPLCYCGSLASNITILLFKKTRQTGNKMGLVYALDQPHLFFYVPPLHDPAGY